MPRSHPPKLTSWDNFSSCTSFIACCTLFWVRSSSCRTASQLRLSAASMIALACGVIEFPTPIPFASARTRWPMSFTAGASSACTATKPSAITVPSNRAIRGRSVKFVPLSLRTCSFQLTAPNLFRAPKISFGNGTTTSSTVFDSCLISICCGVRAPWAHGVRPITAIALSFKYLVNGIIGSFDC